MMATPETNETGQTDAALHSYGKRAAHKKTKPIDMVTKLNHIYDLRRDCLLNELYYGHRLNRYGRINLWLEATIVIGSGASGVSGWIIWTTYPELKGGWAAIAAVATLLAALKPVLHIDARIKRYSALFSGYRQLSLGMDATVQDIAEARGIAPDIERDVNRVQARYRSLSSDDDPKPSSRLVDRLQQQVNKRLPLESFFFPRTGQQTSSANSQSGIG